MRVEQVMFRSGSVRCAGDLYLPDGADGIRRAAGVVMGHSVVMVKEALERRSSSGVEFLRVAG
jgi:uncharacterized protein